MAEGQGEAGDSKGKEAQWVSAPAPAETIPGLEYLTEIDQLFVEQQVELLEAIKGFETKNRYRICNSLGEDVYSAVEHSNCCLRQFCGSCRPFVVTIMDSAEREVIHLERPLRCSSWCCFCCLQEVEVQSPPGSVIGYIKQDITLLFPWFSIQNVDRDTVLKVKGPCCTWPWTCSELEFEVMSADGSQSIGKITKQWSGPSKEVHTDADNFGIQFPMDIDPKVKAILLGATFLIDYMFFER